MWCKSNCDVHTLLVKRTFSSKLFPVHLLVHLCDISLFVSWIFISNAFIFKSCHVEVLRG